MIRCRPRVFTFFDTLSEAGERRQCDPTRSTDESTTGHCAAEGPPVRCPSSPTDSTRLMHQAWESRGRRLATPSAAARVDPESLPRGSPAGEPCARSRSVMIPPFPFRPAIALSPLEGLTTPEIRDLFVRGGGLGLVCTEFVRI